MRLSWVALLGLACILGGAARPGAPGDVSLQLIAALSILAWGRVAYSARARPVRVPVPGMLLGVAAIALIATLVQVLPIYRMIGAMGTSAGLTVELASIVPAVGLPGAPSVDPGATISAILSMLPALVVLGGACLASARDRRLATLVLLGVGAVSVFFGLLQVAQGPQSAFRISETGDALDAVGFFANRNHFSALLYVLLLLTFAWALHAASRASAAPAGSRYEPAVLLPQIACLALIVIFLATQMFTRSRAGLLLTLTALVGAMLLAASVRRAAAGSSSGPSLRLLAAVVVSGVLVLSEVTVFRATERFVGDPLAGRTAFARNTLEAAMAHLPLGSGLGTFVPVYGLFEQPNEALLDAFANRAHNDFLELCLETGVFGVLAVALFLAWLARTTFAIWLRPSPDGEQIDLLLARAASIAVILLLLHSAVDYPLRTTALLTVGAFLCALMVAPLAKPAAAKSAAERPDSAKPSLNATPMPTKPLSAGAGSPGRGSPSSQAGCLTDAGGRRPGGPPHAAPGVPGVPEAPRPGAPRSWQAGGEWPDEWRRK